MPDTEDLTWISCSPTLLQVLKHMGLPGYSSCAQAPRRPGGLTGPDLGISHFHGVPMAIAATWDQYETEKAPPSYRLIGEKFPDPAEAEAARWGWQLGWADYQESLIVAVSNLKPPGSEGS